TRPTSAYCSGSWSGRSSPRPTFSLDTRQSRRAVPVAEDPNNGAATPPDSAAEEPAEGAATEKRRKFRFPSAFTVLTLVALLVWGLTFVIPAGQYELNDDGAPVPGTYEEIDAPLGFVDRVEDFFLAPVNGLYGIESVES